MIPLEKKFIREDCFLILPIQKPEIPSHIHKEAEQRGLVVKKEFHISVAVTKNAKKIAEIVSQHSNSKELSEHIATLFESFTWEYTLTDEYYLQENFYSEKLADQDYATGIPEHTRRTIIQKVTLDDLLPFYEKLSHILGITLSIPVPHITLFSWSDYPPFMTRGIGICSEEDFKVYSRGRL